MEKKRSEQNFNNISNEVSNFSYLKLLEKHILVDKTNDLEHKHKEWGKFLSNKK